jgi:predicted PurR-regulated permease PerM
LFVQGRTVAGSVIVVTGLVVISGIDHFVRPQLTRLGRSRLHPLLVFLGMFGGMASLGGWGLFAGPLLIALGVAAIRLYDRDQQARLRGAVCLRDEGRGDGLIVVPSRGERCETRPTATREPPLPG